MTEARCCNVVAKAWIKPFSTPSRFNKKAIALSQQRQKCDRYNLYLFLND
ncbi:hypothetical protein [Nostoc sphaeroides]|uniref:Uncharacterized protein n=1 Tax=Nostoc sphaeroides CCNUC1 TaxID=2653204 RepID=A0A5P8VVP3_9NOSO|nr:hypothetical protein [Nostoc sphaeroides]QFS44417.1 hypothetical protein GXM_01892 [Nostoc sphaeroides CCNUC1]